MRTLLLLLAGLAVVPAASAQETASILVLAPEDAETLLDLLADDGRQWVVIDSVGVSGGQRLGLYASGMAGGVLAPLVLGNTINAGLITVLSIPVGAALGVHFTSEAYGLDGAFSGTLGNATLGFALGAGTGFVLAYAICSNEDCQLDSNRFGGAVLGAAMLVTLTPGIVAAHRRIRLNAHVAPAALAAPTGETVPGLVVRVGL